MKYYNIYVGVDWTTIEVSETEKFKMDEHNNPLGDKFDLGKTGAFREFRILIGNFFQRGEFNAGLFKYAWQKKYNKNEPEQNKNNHDRNKNNKY
jgi:hypothetical protein